MRPVVAMVVMLVGCGRFHFDAAGPDDGRDRDAPAQVDDGGTATCNSVARIADTFATDQRATLWAGSYFDGTSSATREVASSRWRDRRTPQSRTERSGR